MNYAWRGAWFWVVLLAYAWFEMRANAQVDAQLFDSSVQISNQVDIQTLQDLADAARPATAPENTNRQLYVETWIDKQLPFNWQSQGVFLINTFNEKNSFVGKGVSDAFGTQLGWGFQSGDAKTVIQPFINYANSNTDLVGNNSAHSHGYGASVNMTRELLAKTPLLARDAEANPGVDAPTPNFGIVSGLNLSYLDTNLATYAKGWSYDTQDAYTLSPNLSFNYTRRKSNEFPDEPHDAWSVFPEAISLVPTYAYGMTEGRMGTSGSAGLLSVQDRNTWSWEFGTNDNDKRTLQLIQSNTWYRDTNQEMLTAPTGHLEYQNWARFGFAISYADFSHDDFKVPTVKLEYDYDAFNNQFEQHVVTLTINVRF
jgi:hypothetical protein